MTVLVSMIADHSSCLRSFELPRPLHMNDAPTYITIIIPLLPSSFIVVFIYPLFIQHHPRRSSISLRNLSVLTMEREVSCPIASCSWTSSFSTQAWNWDLGGSVSLVRVALVRLGGSVLFLSYHVMVSTKLSHLVQKWNTYDIFNASKSYGKVRVRGVLVFGRNVDASFSNSEGDTTSWSLISQVSVSMTASVFLIEVTV